MTGLADDRDRLSGDSRFSRLQQSIAGLPESLTAISGDLELTLIRDVRGSPTMTLAGVRESGVDTDRVGVAALKKPFVTTLDEEPAFVFMAPLTDYPDQLVPVSAALIVITQRQTALYLAAQAADDRGQSLFDLLDDPKVDPRPLVRDVYGNLAMTLEEYVVTFRMINTVHKQAVQNAVDIVQSKRLEFFESGESPNWNGVLFMIAIVIFIELAVVPVAASVIGSLIAGLARVSPKAAGAVIGSGPARELEKSIASLRNISMSLKATNRERLSSALTAARSGRGAGTSVFDAKLMKQTYKEYDSFVDAPVKNSRDKADDILGQQTQVYEQVAALIRTGQGKEHLAGLTKDNIKTAAKVGKEVAGGFSGKKKKHRPKQQTSTVMPLDVLLKKNVQNVLDIALWEAEQTLTHIKRIGTLAYRANPGIPANRKTLVQAIKDAPFWEKRVLELGSTMDPVHEALDDPGIDAIGVDLAIEYELRLWVMLYATRYAAHRGLGISSPPSRTAGAWFWKEPVTEEDTKSFPPDRYRHYWRDISRETYETYEKEGYVVAIRARGDKNKRKALMDYLRARFTRLTEMDDDAIAEFMADTHALLQNFEVTGKTFDLSEEELTQTGIVWQHIDPDSEEETEGEANKTPEPLPDGL